MDAVERSGARRRRNRWTGISYAPHIRVLHGAA